jgi:hypothetical protein
MVIFALILFGGFTIAFTPVSASELPYRYERNMLQDINQGSVKVSQGTSVAEEGIEDKDSTTFQLAASNTNGIGEYLKSGIASGPCSVAISGNGSYLTIEARINTQYTNPPYNYIFGKLFIDGVELKDFTYQTVITKQNVSLNSFSTGYHTAFLQVYNKETGKIVDLLYKTYIPYNGITERPGYKGVFDVYSKYFTYNPYNMALQNQAGKLYMEYKTTKAKNWQRSGYMQANMIQLYTQQSYKIDGLKADKKYQTRIRYGEYVTYGTDFLGDGKSYFFGGPVLSTGTIKTGKAKAPKIKSVKVKAVKVKYHKVKHYGAYTGVYLYTEKFYTCKFKVTVNLKKKPGTKGIWVNGRFLKGNKKRYTTTFTPYPNYYTKRPPKGLSRYKLSICSYKSKAYGGYSPLKAKSVKIK